MFDLKKAEIEEILYNRQVNYSIMYLMWQAYHGEKQGKEFYEKLGMSRTTIFNITKQLEWEYDPETKFITKEVLSDKLKKISHLAMAKSTGISADIFLGNKKFELRGIVKDSVLEEFLCFKQSDYQEEYPERYKEVKNKIKDCLRNAELSFDNHTDLWRLRNFCVRKSTQEIVTMLDVAGTLTDTLSVHNIDELSPEQYNRFKHLIPKLKEFCNDMEAVIKYKELLDKKID